VLRDKAWSKRRAVFKIGFGPVGVCDCPILAPQLIGPRCQSNFIEAPRLDCYREEISNC
jgi:hypothetical protein